MRTSARLLRFGITTLLGAIALVALTGRAEAYPQFQFSSGTNRCGQCHYSPGGGGLLTSWGRDEAGDTISMGGNGAFLHGAVPLPPALALGGDLRFAVLSNDVGGAAGSELAAFPMQLDVYGRVAIGESWSVNVTLGDRGIVRPDGDAIGGQLGTAVGRIMSREHYVMWRPSATGPYARAGRFFAPYGLRFAEHVFYVRRYTGFNLYEETYNLSGGYVADDYEGHVTLFAPVPAGMPGPLAAIGPQQSGVAAYGELRLAKISALGAQMRLAFGNGQTRLQGGAVGKLWVEKAKVLFLGEANIIHQTLADADYVPGMPALGVGSYSQNQFVSYLGLNLFPVRGVMFGLAYERFQENLSVAGTGRNAFDVQASVFPWAHCEIMLLGRYQWTGSGAPDGAGANLAMLQLHYYL